MSHEALNPEQFADHLYHVAHPSNRASIMKRGLDPKRGESSEGSSGLTWFYGRDPREGMPQGEGNLSPELGKHSDIWRANVTGIHKAHGSTSSFEWVPGDPVWTVSKRIKPSRLKLIHEGMS